MKAEVERIARQVEGLATPLVQTEGMEVWGAELRTEGGRWILRLLVDREGGVTLDDLTRVSRQLNDLLDVHDVVPWRYTLEVSSPGVSRPLMRPDHYGRYLGKRVKVRTSAALGGRRVFCGPLLEVGEEEITVSDGGRETVRIPFSLILKAAYEHDFSPGEFVSRKSKFKRSAVSHQQSASDQAGAEAQSFIQKLKADR